MGNTAQTIIYDCNSKYVGQVSNNLPHGKGILNIHKNSSASNGKLLYNNENFTIIESEFQNGTLKKCIINLKNGLKYEGAINEKNNLDGEGKLTD